VNGPTLTGPVWALALCAIVAANMLYGFVDNLKVPVTWYDGFILLTLCCCIAMACRSIWRDRA
jgi:uncharacterized membrane protein YhhN